MPENHKKIANQDIPGEKNDLKVDVEKLEKVKEIVHILAKTISLIKIFPPEHSSVKGFTEELSEKIVKFLDKYWDLEVGIEEFSFIFQGKTVYHDDNPIKSLPFLFFKDGMQKLFFYKGLNKEQLQEFMGIIKKYYVFPPGKADIVNLLWEKDFANIRCYAADDFLETKIGIGKEPIDFKIDRMKFQTGTIELRAEDRNELSKSSLSSEFFEMEPEKPKKFDQAQKFSSLNERESRALKLKLDANRKISAEAELVFLILEMLYIEEETERFSATLNFLAHSHHDIIRKGNFHLANQLLSHIFDLREFLSSQSTENVELIDKFLKDIQNRESLDSIKKTLLESDLSDFDSLFAYLKSLGPATIPYLGELFEEVKSPDFRLKVSKYLHEISQNNLPVLMEMAKEERPVLTKEIISILGSIKEKRSLQFLANFISSQNKSIKRAAIEALGKIEDVSASKILVGFMADEDKTLRILAAQNIYHFGDTPILSSVIDLVKKKRFRKKSHSEKQALLDLLARSKTEEAEKTLEKLLKKSSFFFGSKQNETRLCAVKALRKMGTPKVFEVLRKGTQIRTKKIREACRISLDEMSAENLRHDSEKGDQDGPAP